MDYAEVYLKKNRREAISEKSPWIFSGAIEAVREFDEDGGLCRILLEDEVVATGYVNTQTNIAVRILDFGKVEVNTAFIRRRFHESRRMKETLLQGGTDAYRLIHAEGDRFPGLVVDRYGDYLVLQSSTAGIDNLRPLIVEALIEEFQPRGILEKSSSTSRKTEGLESAQQVLHGEIPDEIIVQEHGLKYAVDLHGGQKTGF